MGDKKVDAEDSKHRSWGRDHNMFEPSANWPIVEGAGRRRMEQLDTNSSGVHQIVFNNGTTAWAFEWNLRTSEPAH